jgi:hypothetical protein
MINPYCTQPAPLPSAPRLLNFTVRQLTVQDGALVVGDPYFNPITSLKAANGS